VFRGEDPLLKVGVIMMALALALVIVAVVVSIALRSEPERVVAAEVAAKSPREEPQRYPSFEEEPPQHYSSSSYGAAKPQVEKPKEPQSAATQEAEPPPAELLLPPSKPKPNPIPNAKPEPLPRAQQKPRPQPEALPGAEANHWPKPTPKELDSANRARHYGLPPGAIMGLTIKAMGIYNAPVFDSDSQWALTNGVAHVPETSLPWSATAQRNVFLAGHRMGYRGTWSRLIFYNLNELNPGDEVLLKDRSGKAYRYRVSEVFLAGPYDSWVMGQVVGRDMVTLQTCTPIPTFEKRLIVRADRV
jgi:sortase A